MFGTVVVNSGKPAPFLYFRICAPAQINGARYLCCSIPRPFIHITKHHERHDRHVSHGTLPGALRHDRTCPPSTCSLLDVTAQRRSIRNSVRRTDRSFQRPGRSVRVTQRRHGPQAEGVSQVAVPSSRKDILDPRCSEGQARRVGDNPPIDRVGRRKLLNDVTGRELRVFCKSPCPPRSRISSPPSSPRN